MHVVLYNGSKTVVVVVVLIVCLHIFEVTN